MFIVEFGFTTLHFSYGGDGLRFLISFQWFLVFIIHYATKVHAEFIIYLFLILVCPDIDNKLPFSVKF
jgi:hypothetical protein